MLRIGHLWVKLIGSELIVFYFYTSSMASTGHSSFASAALSMAASGINGDGNFLICQREHFGAGCRAQTAADTFFIYMVLHNFPSCY